MKKLSVLGLILILVSLSACTTLQRTAIQESELRDALPYGIAVPVRIWGDSLEPDAIETILATQIARARRVHAAALASDAPINETALALSGGGPDGAFGAGVLAGWTERGDRPNFSVVTGVSTGAIIAVFAFLGPDYDEQLREFYTQFRTQELLRPAPFAALTGAPSIADTSGYNALIDTYIDDDLVAQIAQEARKGRTLLIGTTNLDASRPVIWNLSLIAASGHPQAKNLIRDLVRASSAIPAVFPPAVIPSILPDGRVVDELHVDGGATQQVMLFSPGLPIRRIDEALGRTIDRTLWVIVNNSLRKPYEPVELGVLSIAGRAASSLIGGSGDGDLYRIYTIAERDNIDFNVLWIPETFDEVPTEMFDPVYMSALYDLGYQYGLAGDQWQSAPPNFVTQD